MALTVPFNIIENIEHKIKNSLSLSLTSIIHKEYPTYTPFIYDIANAYFRYNYLSVIESTIPTDLVDNINRFILVNEYEKLELIDENMEHAIKDFLIKTGKKEYVNLTHDIIFLIYKKYNKVPLYSQNIIFPKNVNIK